MLRLRALVALLCCAPLANLAAPLSNTEIGELCAEADDAVHCGRLIEREQLKRLPGLARRNGAELSVSLFPQGAATFTDSDEPVKGRSYSLWDYIDGINAVLLYTTAGEKTTFILLQRTTNRRYELPTEPQLSPDRQWLATADICGPGCTNEIALWRIARDGIRKELTWSPGADWIDASARWKDAGTLVIEYSVADSASTTTLERKLGDPSWKRVP
jgi:hypothetical protein